MPLMPALSAEAFWLANAGLTFIESSGAMNGPSALSEGVRAK